VGAAFVFYEWSDWRCGVVYWTQFVAVAPHANGAVEVLAKALLAAAAADPECIALRAYPDRDDRAATATFEAVGLRMEHYDVMEWRKPAKEPVMRSPTTPPASSAGPSSAGPSPTITVREATLSDADTIASWQVAMAKETENYDLDPATVLRGIQVGLGRPSLARYFIAEAEGTDGSRMPAGTLLVTYEWHERLGAMLYWLQSVYVAPACRKLGVFRSTYQHVRSVADSDANCIGIRLYVEQENVRAKAAYKSLGLELETYCMLRWLK
jgi:ribosomal protein S18 acetylase RimI-like enzyme